MALVMVVTIAEPFCQRQGLRNATRPLALDF
jgi:hypothetical protein